MRFISLLLRRSVAWILVCIFIFGCAEQSLTQPTERQNFGQLRSALEMEREPTNECASQQGISPAGKSLVINQPALLAEPFSFQKLLEQLSGNESTQAKALLVSSMLSSYRNHMHTHPITELLVPVDTRGGEADMAVEAVIEGLRPVAVFNRIDLASSDGSDCGEYRVVYAKTEESVGMPDGRFFIIFEARYPNPNLPAGRSGCAPLARFWQSIEDLPTQEAVSRVSELFHSGLELEGIPHPPVLQHSHFAPPFGQVRTNNFIQFRKWQLREFRTGFDVDGNAVFVVDTVKDVPLTELYSDLAIPKPISAGPILESLRAAFQDDLVENQLPRLMAPELRGAEAADDLIMGFSVNFDERFYEFQSDSQGPMDEPAVMAKAQSISQRISAALPQDSDLTVSHILNRLGALTCGGCHRFSAGKEIAPGVLWPQDAGFVHVLEDGQLSPALTGVFLPARKKLLESLLCEFPRQQVDPPEDPEGTFLEPPTLLKDERSQSQIEMGRQTLPPHSEQLWTRIEFENSFSAPPAVFVTPHGSSLTACDTRVRQIDETGFEVTCLQPAGEPVSQDSVGVSYVAVEKGIGLLGEVEVNVDCAPVQAFQSGLDYGKQSNASWDTLSFETPFGNRPVVIAEIQSDYAGRLQAERSNTSPIVVSPTIGAVSRDGVSIALDFHEQPLPDEIDFEIVCYAAFSEGSFQTFGEGHVRDCRVATTEAIGGRKALFARFGEALSNSPIALDSLLPSHFGTTMLIDLAEQLSGLLTVEGALAQLKTAFGSETSHQKITVASKTSRREADGGWVRALTVNEHFEGFFVEEDRAYDQERRHSFEQVDSIQCDEPAQSLTGLR